MKPPPFEYHRAESADEAVALLAEYGDEAKILAGGQSLVPLLSLRLAHPAYLVDINPASELAAVTNGNGLRIGALVRHRTVERSDLVLDTNPLLAFAVRFIGHAAIRTRGTLGGSLAHADPAAELPTVLSRPRGINRSVQRTRDQNDPGEGALPRLSHHHPGLGRAAHVRPGTGLATRHRMVVPGVQPAQR